MKVFMMTDMEGVSGIHKVEYTDRESGQYAEGRRLLTADVNAAIEGALAGGADEIVVLDSHAGGDHLIVEEVHPAATIDHGAPGRWWGSLDKSFDALFQVGMHAMAGTAEAFLDHTQSSQSWFNYYVNGRKMGELGQFAVIAGHFGVPNVLVAGDRAACVEAKEFFPGVETAEVKYALCRNRATVLSVKKAHDLIRQAAQRAVGLAGKVKPLVVEPPIEIVLETMRTDLADELGGHRGTERVGPRTVRKVVNSALDILMF